MSLTVFMQALWHIAVAVVLVPTKGLALPFVSYGGSSLIASMLAVGLVMRCAEDSQSGVIGTVATPVGPSGSRMWAPS
jgi:cell division protein FtsW